jgi:hypothetical protein
VTHRKKLIITGRNYPRFLKPNEQIARVTEAFLKMKKFDLAELRNRMKNDRKPD